jgi:hypothetical protein
MQLNKNYLYENKHVNTSLIYRIKEVVGNVVYYGCYLDKTCNDMVFANIKFKDHFINDFKIVGKK